MILVLLYRFSESVDTLIGYQLCQRLVQNGRDIYVTTTSTGKWLNAEIQNARDMTKKSSGSITILEPRSQGMDEPTSEWIANLHKNFEYLSNLKHIDAVIGMLPGTTQTAVGLKKTFNCKLVLLAAAKIGEGEEMKKEINILTNEADEVWSLGSDTYSHYHNIFKEVKKTQSFIHKEILLQPTTSGMYYWQGNSITQSSLRVRKIVSVWNKPSPFYHKGQERYSNGSNVGDFYSLGAALAKINNASLQRNASKLQWNIHGLRFQDSIVKSIEERAKPNKLKLSPLSSATSVDDLTWKNCLAFIVPDVSDESFNFIALSAIWLGIPTLVSSRSSIGKFLSRLSESEKNNAVVQLTGNFEADKEIWIEKIHQELLNSSAQPTKWAKSLSEHLHSNLNLWELDLSCLSSNPTNHSSLASVISSRIASEEPKGIKRSSWDSYQVGYVMCLKLKTFNINYSFVA